MFVAQMFGDSGRKRGRDDEEDGDITAATGALSFGEHRNVSFPPTANGFPHM